MKVSLKNDLLFADGKALNAEDIYASSFDDRGPISRHEILATGLEFSDEPASPAIILEAQAAPLSEPTIRPHLAGIVGGRVTLAGAGADYIITDGVWHPLPPGTLDEYRALLAGLGSGDHLTVTQYLEILPRANAFKVIDRAAPVLSASLLASQLVMPDVTALRANPYAYQRTGIAWLSFLTRHGVGSILADEMGLGKTLQIIGLFAAELAAGRSGNLVLCPATLLENWRREVDRFLPSAKVLIHAGPHRTGLTEILSSADVVITSFDTLVADISLFKSVRWNVVVADEAQNLKNPSTRRTVRAQQVPRRVAIAVTGTPLENRLRDIWSITEFVLPGYLGALHDFERAHPDTDAGARDVEPAVSAIMLRRRVVDVAQDLPDKIEIPVPITLDEIGARTYEQVRAEAAQRHPANPTLASIVTLRMYCAHPWAADQNRDIRDPLACSPKLERCLEILSEFADTREKALVFTSFNEVAELLQSVFVQRLGVPVGCVNGTVPVATRQRIIDEFGEVTGPAILVLNPKAAGVGLNITAANHVIHYNLEWNPAVEDQASARAYRRGQTRPVTIHRLFYVDTVEEVVNDRLSRKRVLANNAVVGSSGEEQEIADIVKALQRSPVNL